MNCTLMHKNIEVAGLIIAESAVAITEIGKIHNPEHIPLGVQAVKGRVDIGELNDWLKGRSIPASRSGIWDLYVRLGRNSTEHLILECYGLSLSDHYWIRPAGSGFAWADINFFQNDFSKDVGEMLFGREPADRNNINLVSPDNTSDGWLRKKWIIAKGKRMLVKGSSEPWKQEPFNEVVATAVMGRLGIAHVPYTLMFEGAEPYSLCENFLSLDTELVPAWKVLHSSLMNDGDSDFTHLMRCCDRLGIPDVSAAIDKMLTLDYIIANEDRHYTNFGFVRNAETLDWLGVAPIFDSGTSLWHNALNIGEPRKCQPFAKTHVEQIKLVSDFSWFDIGALTGLEQEIAEIFSKSPIVNESRAKAIAKAVLNRAGTIEMKSLYCHIV
ncbi:MAG: excisionase [Clostridiales bacterium]|nr:excisionase [Clostridiales bacterium]